MRLETLELSNFRNYESARHNFRPGVNAIIGPNGRGKTNLLEAICILIAGRSPRTSHARELIRWNEKSSHLRADISVGGRVTELKAELAGNRKTLEAWCLPIERKCLAGVVTFFPDHLRILKDEPEKRRSFLDELLEAISPPFSFQKHRYLRAVRQRNVLLRRPGASGNDALFTWDAALIDYGSQIIKSRLELLAKLRPPAATFYHDVKGERLEMDYQSTSLDSRLGNGEIPSLDDIKHNLSDDLARSRDREWEKGITLVGPHRDELRISAEGAELRKFGSQGEHRTAALALKFAQLRMFSDALREPPLFLLDDVLSELDEERRARFFCFLGEEQQAFITTTHLSDASGCGKDINVIKLDG